MTDLTQDSLEKICLDMAFMINSGGETTVIKPKQLIVPLGMFKLARNIMFPHYILKRRKGVRGRAMTLKWRRK